MAQTYTRRWPAQENAIRDWLIPLGIDTNHGYAKERVVNSELAKRQGMELSLQVTLFETTGQAEERSYFPVKARQLAVDWEMRQRKAKLEKNAVRRQALLNKCEGSCQELRQVLRRQEDHEAQAREMYELDHAKDQIMTLFKVALANVGIG